MAAWPKAMPCKGEGVWEGDVPPSCMKHGNSMHFLQMLTISDCKKGRKTGGGLGFHISCSCSETQLIRVILLFWSTCVSL